MHTHFTDVCWASPSYSSLLAIGQPAPAYSCSRLQGTASNSLHTAHQLPDISLPRPQCQIPVAALLWSCKHQDRQPLWMTSCLQEPEYPLLVLQIKGAGQTASLACHSPRRGILQALPGKPSVSGYLAFMQECTPVCPFVQENAHTSAPEDLQAREPCALGALQPNKTLAHFTLCLLCSKAFDRTVSMLQRYQCTTTWWFTI